ncbi:Cyclic nucleotide-binding domain-containing protein [Heracleum sosnowskyi]|uniref:Cyclic nucleotide-binding domain-containing protein n=1 Tax=Heracleum sosnowskyi TaxID=360622 RepID=A0AAD8I9W5_9APIA|nr:Cyclic nucleotide-binding domain-containing protein [Heracleum sosnowskyi]
MKQVNLIKKVTILMMMMMTFRYSRMMYPWRKRGVKDSDEDSLLSSELNLHVLKEAKMFHFNSEVLTSPSMHASLFKAISLSKKSGSLIFFDPNLPLPLRKSRDETKKVIKKAWEQADVIEITKQELEFLLDEDHYVRRRNFRPQYYADDYEQTKNRRDYYHYTREEVSPLWHPGLQFLFNCSGDAVLAAIMRKLTTQPEMFQDQDVLERQIRFAITAGIISQWTISAVRGFPTESAVQNLKEQVYLPSMW